LSSISGGNVRGNCPDPASTLLGQALLVGTTQISIQG